MGEILVHGDDWRIECVNIYRESSAPFIDVEVRMRELPPPWRESFIERMYYDIREMETVGEGPISKEVWGEIWDKKHTISIPPSSIDAIV